jgi:hypothetical protein
MQIRTADKSEWTWFSDRLRIQKNIWTKWSPLDQNSEMFLTCQLDDRTKRSHHPCPFLCAGACKHLPAFLCMSKSFIHKISKLQSNKYYIKKSNKYEIKHYSNATLKPSKGHLDLFVAHNFLSKKSLPNTCINLKTCFQPYAMWSVVRFISVLFKPTTGPWKKFTESCEY